MNIVDLRSASQEDPEPDQPDWASRLHGILSPARLALILLIIGFLLVLASQWFPLIRISNDTHVDDTQDVPRQLGMINAASLIQLPYYLTWLTVFVTAGASIYSQGAWRRALFGAAAGALAVEALIVIPVLHTPSLLVSDFGEDMQGLRMQHAPGYYALIAAFVVIVVALVVAVEGRILPQAVTVAKAVAPARGSMHEALAESVPSHENGAADIDFGWSSRRAEVVDGAAIEEPVNSSTFHDHSLYTRPTGDRVS